jgi:hypothetical protein
MKGDYVPFVNNKDKRKDWLIIKKMKMDKSLKPYEHVEVTTHYKSFVPTFMFCSVKWMVPSSYRTRKKQGLFQLRWQMINVIISLLGWMNTDHLLLQFLADLCSSWPSVVNFMIQRFRFMQYRFNNLT